MKRTAIVIAAIVLALLLAASASADRGHDPATLVVSLTPEAAPIELELDAEGLAAFLAERLGRPVVVRVDADYTGTVEAMRSGHAHVAFLSPLASALAHEVAGARMIVAEERGGRPHYFARYWVRADADVETLADLRGTTVAFNDPLSASGYLFPVHGLVEAGLVDDADGIHEFFGRVYFAGGTELSLRALVNGFVDVAGVSEFGPEVFLTEQERAQVRPISRHGPIPNHGVAVSGELSDELVQRLVEAMLSLNQPEHNHILRALYGWQRLASVSTETYLPLVELARSMGLLSAPPRP